MNRVILKLVSIFFGICIFSSAFAQSDFVVTGGQGSGPGGKISYTIGETNFIYNNSSSGSVSQGVQQAFEIYIIKGQDVKEINLEVSAYPNPAPDILKIRIDEGLIENLSYKIYDLLGKLIISNKINEKVTSISLLQFRNSEFILVVYKDNLEVKSFKIIKSK